jgi:hypothetical protein
MNILALGPYVGNFEQEILTFRPYVRWLSEVVDHDKVYINTHKNRSFLYRNFIPEDNVLPIYGNLTREELNQKGYIHDSITQKDFNMMIRLFKESIVDIEGCSKRDLELYKLNYTKSVIPQPLHSKIFEKISDIPEIEIPEEHKGKIVFIPDMSEKNLDRMKEVYSFLIDFDCIVIGDMNTYFTDDNAILKNIDYTENGWKYIIKYIMEASAVVCPLSFWTTICNLQGVPVYSWGNYVAQHKENGIYHFDNNKSLVFPISDDDRTELIIRMLKYFFKGEGIL